MKHILIILTASLLLFSFLIKQKELVGIWKLTNANDPSKFSDTWELKENQTFNELKQCCEGSNIDSLISDETGTWTLKKDTLIITGTGEMHKGEKIIYPKPQTMKFLTKKQDKHFLLTPIKKGIIQNITLKLEK